MTPWIRGRPTVTEKFALLSFLCIVAITVAVSLSLAMVLSRQLVRRDAEVIADVSRALFTRSLPVSYFTDSPSASPALYETRLASVLSATDTVRIIVYDAHGTILWSDDPSLIGHSGHNPRLREALRGRVAGQIVRPGAEEHHRSLQAFDRLEEVYIPLRYEKGGPVVGAVEIYRQAPALFAALDRGLGLVWLLGGGGGIVLYVALLGIVRKSSRTQEVMKTTLADYAQTLEERVARRTSELSRKARDLAALYAVSTTINHSLNTQETLPRALESLLETTGFEGGWIRVLYPGDGGPIVVSRGVAEELVHDLTEQSDLVARTGLPLFTGSKPGERAHDDLAAPPGSHSVALVPIPSHDRPIGTLAVATHARYRFTAEDAQLLASVSQQIGVAINNGQLYAATCKREDEARILYETTVRLGGQTDLDSLLQAIIKGAVAITAASFGGVGFPEGDELVLRQVVVTACPRPRILRLKIARSLGGLTYASGRPQIANDPRRDPRVDQDAARLTGLTNVICTPLQIGGAVVGVLYVCNKESSSFTEHDLVLLTTFASHAAAAIENSRLHRETLRREREASRLYRISAQLYRHNDLDGLLTAIVEGAIEVTEGAAGGIGRRVGDEIVLRPLVGLTLPPGQTEIRLPLASSTAGLTYETGEAVVVNDLEVSNCAPVVREAARGYGIRSFLCAPLQTKDGPVGVIKVCNKQGGAPFTEDDLRLLGTFATHAAMAIDNTRLFQEIKATKEYLENLIESSVDGIVTVSSRGTVTFASEGARRMLGYRDDELLGSSAASYWLRGRGDFRAFRRLLADRGRLQNHETELRTASDGPISVNIAASLLRNPAGQVTGVLGVLRDVTALRKLHEHMVRSERLAATGLLAAGVAHEIGNPVACISFLSQVLLTRTPDPAIQRGLLDIEVHVGRIQRIVHDLTSLARPAPVRFRKSCLNEIVQRAVALARHNPVARKMRITTVLDPGIAHVHVAADQLVQVCLNLILNAGDAGGELTIHTRSDGDSTRAVFADSGKGMSAEELRRVFDPFYSTKDEHLGLGLFVTHEIVRQHGGSLHVESELGRGSAFTLVLPVAG